jgi:hypothetical protein
MTDILLQSSNVQITPRVARFGSTSIQVANIGSVSVHFERKLNDLVIWMLLLTLLVALFAVVILISDPSLHSARLAQKPRAHALNFPRRSRVGPRGGLAVFAIAKFRS